MEEDTSVVSSVSSGEYLSNEPKLDTVDINPSKQQQQEGASITTVQVLAERKLEDNGSRVSSSSASFWSLPDSLKPRQEKEKFVDNRTNEYPIGRFFKTKLFL